MAREPRQLLTVQLLTALAESAKQKPEFTWLGSDARQQGLAFQVRRGRCYFVFCYTSPTTLKRRRMGIGSFPDLTLDVARKIAQDRFGLVCRGIDPIEAEERTQESIRAEQAAACSFKDLADGYLADLKERVEKGMEGKRSSLSEFRRLLSVYVIPNIGRMKARDFTADHLRTLYRGLSSTPGVAGHVLTVIGAVYRWARTTGKLPPDYRIPQLSRKERYTRRGERRALSVMELGKLGAALEEARTGGTLHPSAILAVYVLALTGLRRSELLGHTLRTRRNPDGGDHLRWRDVDLERGLVHLRDSKTGPQTRVIGRAVVDLLRAAKPEGARPTDAVCPGARRGQAYQGIDKARYALWERAGLASDGKRVDLHSLRHSFASIGAHLDGGRYLGFVSVLLGHSYGVKSTITKRYISGDAAALRPAADAIADEVLRLLRGEGGKVLAFPDQRPAAV